MSGAERKKRQREALRNAIVEAAGSLAEEGGMESVSVRAIAERIEYSPRTIYLYFTDKDAVLDAVRERGFSELTAALSAAEAADFAPRPEDRSRLRLKRLGEAYLEFAASRGNLFSLMYLRIPRVFCDPVNLQDPAATDKAPSFMVLFRSVAAYLADKSGSDGPVAEDDVRALSVSLWGMVHGLASIRLFGQDKEFSDLDVRREFGRAFDLLFPIQRS